MRVAVFFVCLFFLLLKGYDHIYTASHHTNISYASAQPIAKTQQVKVANTNQDIVNKDTNPTKVEEYLICDGVEDENNLLVRKCRLLANCFLTLSYLFILRYLYNCFKARFTFFGPLSYRYIIQGVLRI